ncbi:MAG TPA: hypothetical protein VN829_11865, partial [Dongiaceae bacterium]|nr:hypothetical protein [Dongiaceae bacterium]
AQADLPRLSNVYPTGTRPFEPTNAFSFTVTAFGSTFPSNGITLNLDGKDVSSNLVITGSASTRNVVFPNLASNATHFALVAATNVLGHGILVTDTFDTFSESNYMVEAEDFDYHGGQFITNWFPDAYADYNGPYPAVSNIDFQHMSLTGEQFPYRAVGIPQDNLASHDYLRTVFVDAGAVDYFLAYFAATDWANYTRLYPAGAFYVYGRFSGGLGVTYSMFLDEVVSGAGTANEVTRRLGRWSALGRDYVNYDWVPLRDDALNASAVVTLNGLATLRITTAGDCNPNYFMLVPVSVITLNATRSGGSLVLSFPTQSGVPYSVLYRTDLASGDWTLLTAVMGDGTVKSVNDPLLGNTQRFYKVVSP